MRFVSSMSWVAVLLLAGSAVAVQIAPGNYTVSGTVNGTAAMGPPGINPPQTGTMDTAEFQHDWYWYDPINDEYIVRDGGPWGPIVAEFMVTAGGPPYQIQYFSMPGAVPCGTGTWQ